MSKQMGPTPGYRHHPGMFSVRQAMIALHHTPWGGRNKDKALNSLEEEAQRVLTPKKTFRGKPIYPERAVKKLVSMYYAQKATEKAEARYKANGAQPAAGREAPGTMVLVQRPALFIQRLDRLEKLLSSLDERVIGLAERILKLSDRTDALCKAWEIE